MIPEDAGAPRTSGKSHTSVSHVRKSVARDGGDGPSVREVTKSVRVVLFEETSRDHPVAFAIPTVLTYLA